MKIEMTEIGNLTCVICKTKKEKNDAIFRKGENGCGEMFWI
ncbi:MAG: hypothetical protein ACK5IJ_11450 [Mangrovibacterium sp.]